MMKINTFQFLIGTVLLDRKAREHYNNREVSIPYRYGITMKKESLKYHGAKVSIPYRYGITTVLSPFSGTVFFFRLKPLQKVCRPHFFIIANFLEKSSFFQKNIFSSR